MSSEQDNASQVTRHMSHVTRHLHNPVLLAFVIRAITEQLDGMVTFKGSRVPAANVT
jgi:hypothetical protein